jgi:shikimate dehydrogenase
MTDNYAVIGNPIAHSKSPLIHAAFAEQTGEDVRYGRLLGDLEDFAGDVRDFLAGGGVGLNVTLPFKERAYRLADESSERADAARAVNTLIKLADGRLRGDTTDGAGLVHDLAGNHGFQFRGAHILLLGAGGAARGVLRPLLEAKPAKLVVANRTPEKAKVLVAELTPVGSLVGCGLVELSGQRFDLVINATAAGLHGQNPSLPDDCLNADAWTYDMYYGDSATPFVLWGRAMGAAKALDGLGMLVEQAAESFYLWRGVRPDTAPVIARLRNA